MTSPTTSFAPLTSTTSQSYDPGMQYQYHPSTTDMNWPNRILPPPVVKSEPLEPNQHVYYESQSAHSPRESQRYVSQAFRYNSAPMYQGRLPLQGPSTQMFADRQGRANGNDIGISAYLTASEVSQYNWQQQQQQQYAHRYQSSRSSFSSSMLAPSISNDSTATVAPGDAMKPSSPASFTSCGNGPAPEADVSIIFHPATYPQIQSGNLQASAAFVSPMDVQGTRHLAVPDVTSPSLCSTDWSSCHIPLPNVDPPVAASPLREIPGNAGTDYSSDTLQEISYSEHEDSDSDEDADFEDDDEDDDGKHGEGVMTASIHGYRVQSLLDMPAATSNLRNNPANDGVTDPTRIPPRLSAFASDLPRAAATAASKKISALIKPGGAEYAEESDKPKTKAKPSPKRKRTTKAKPKATTVKKRAITVTSAAVCRIPNPIPNYQINKKSRGRTVTTDPNEIDSNVVHVCPVPSCGACFKRREHVKRHIRGLHTEDKPYDCRFPGCKSTFTRGDNLKGHYIKVHKTTIEELYEKLDLPLL
ncbi:hypothetical protein NCC49_000063 [Naganishia albida]|nr:hypothetical protein NCC49_000063 [Naganishia albida]